MCGRYPNSPLQCFRVSLKGHQHDNLSSTCASVVQPLQWVVTVDHLVKRVEGAYEVPGLQCCVQPARAYACTYSHAFDLREGHAYYYSRLQQCKWMPLVILIVDFGGASVSKPHVEEQRPKASELCGRMGGYTLGGHILVMVNC